MEEKSWSVLEKLVRRIAELKFGATARAENIAGIKCDCVLDLKDGMVVVIEISEQKTIEKLRSDINKFNIIRPYFFGKNLFPKCYFVTNTDPTPSLIESGLASNITVLSVGQFFESFAGWSGYITARETKSFGSAVDLYSGNPDFNTFIQVQYCAEDGSGISPKKIAEELASGKIVVLIGDYGSGKSRCVQEVFGLISGEYKTKYRIPIAINLRDNWGLKRYSEIIDRHFTDLGLGASIPDFVKVAFFNSVIYLLDGFDEIGAQTWSDDPAKLVEIRKHSLVGVKDLIGKATGGVLITGREHYFNNDEEMVSCLGLGGRGFSIYRCNSELTDAQFSDLIALDLKEIDIPAWVPRKPLIGTIMKVLDRQVVKNLFKTSSGQVDFWDMLIETFCVREAKINPILDSSVIRQVYTQIGRIARATENCYGPISIKSLNEAFESATGRQPTEESAVILQRLPGLGRIAAESPDRQFVDAYILDGLKAEDIMHIFDGSDEGQKHVEWRHPIESFGITYLGSKIKDAKILPGIFAYLKRNKNIKNKIILSDLVSGVLMADGDNLDFGGININGGKFHYLMFSEKKIKGLKFSSCTFQDLDITDYDNAGVAIDDSIIFRLSGVSSDDHLPAWITNSIIDKYQSLSTLSEIREAGLSVSQTFLLSSLRKLFLQPGSGRMESSMYKGYGDSISKKKCVKVIGLLLKEKFCVKIKGKSGALYLPVRAMAGRVNAIMSQMTLSKDELWIEACKI